MKQNPNNLLAQVTIVLIDEIGAAMNMETAEAKSAYLKSSWSGPSRVYQNKFKARVDRAAARIISLTQNPESLDE